MASFTALVFPGQGAQHVGMGADVAACDSRARAVFAAASRVLGYDLLAICAEGHAIDDQILARVLARDPSRDDDVSTWIAWEGDEPISVVWLTHGDGIGVWEMMTPPAHRQRGAARAVLTAALAQSWQPSVTGAFLWATPAGRPLYESLAFRALDEPTIWVTPGGEAGNLAVGQPG